MLSQTFSSNAVNKSCFFKPSIKYSTSSRLACFSTMPAFTSLSLDSTVLNLFTRLVYFFSHICYGTFPSAKFFPLHSLGAKWVHFLTLTSCALDPRALISSLKQPNCTQKPQEPSLKLLRIKPFNDSPCKPLLHKGKNAPTY